MDVTIQEILLVSAFFIALSVIPIVLQVWFTICKRRWLVWVFPVISFLLSLNATFTSYTATVAEGANGWRVVLVFVLFNLLTVALLITTWVCDTVQARRVAKAAAKKEKEAARAAKDAQRETIELK